MLNAADLGTIINCCQNLMSRASLLKNDKSKLITIGDKSLELIQRILNNI